ncbi:unnamed protein product [Cunninghamella echinulata]
MSVEDFFNGGFAMSDDEDALDNDLQKLETVQVEESDDDAEFLKITKPDPVKEKEDEDVDMDNSDDVEDDLKEEEIEDDDEDDSDKDDNEMDQDEDEEDEDEEDEDEEIKDEDEDDSDKGSSDEDDDIDNKTKLKRDAEKHKKEMEELKKRDPEFYKFLEKEDADLLNFGMSDDDEEEEEEEEEEGDNEMDDDDEDEDEEDDDDKQQQKKHRNEDKNIFNDEGLIIVTKTLLAQWIDKIEKNNNIKATKCLFSAFKTATRMADEEAQEKIDFTYKIIDSTVFNNVLTSTMRLAPIIFNKHLQSKSTDASPKTSHQWSFWKTVVKTYLNNLLHLLKSLTDSNMQYLAIREAEKCTVYWTCYDKMAKEYLKILLNCYSGHGSTDNVRIQSFLAIRTLASSKIVTKNNNGESYLDICLKNIYLTFVRSSKMTNVHTLPAINLMRNLAVELFGLDETLSYQQAFVYIRQLAIHLRGAMQTKTSETHKTVYNWQYIHCIDFWSNVLSTYCQPKEDDDEESPLKPLIYPLTQVALGTIRLIPTAQYYPLRFHILRSMASLCEATKAYITLTPYILEVLDSPELKNKAKPSTAKPLDWDIHLRAPKPYLRGRIYQDGILDQVVELLEANFKPYYHHISFPEMIIPTIVTVKRFVKKSKNAKGNQKLIALVKKLEIKSTSVQIQRSRIELTPNDEKARHYLFA